MTEAVQVFVRIRPLLETENPAEDPDCQQIVSFDELDGHVRVKDYECQYDRVFGPQTTQEDIFLHLHDRIEAALGGINSTVFAYGQTGSGKTHTMLGTGLEDILMTTAQAEDETEVKHEAWGVIPRAVQLLFDRLRSHEAEGLSASVNCSYLQIYNERIFDLLQDGAREKPLSVREQFRHGEVEVYVPGLSEVRVSSTDDVMRLLRRGGYNRAVRATEYNEHSSRSHALLQLSIELETAQPGGATIIRRAKINLVDLAGSEKWNVMHALGQERTDELRHINKSLSALGHVIAALAEHKRLHVPYRNSKLTRLLQDSLGGNTRTTVIATLSPTRAAADDSVSTMVFADRARQVITRVRPNEVVDDATLLATAQRKIRKLEKQLRRWSRIQNQFPALKAYMEELELENEELRRALRGFAEGRIALRTMPAEPPRPPTSFPWSEVLSSPARRSPRKVKSHLKKIVSPPSLPSVPTNAAVAGGRGMRGDRSSPPYSPMGEERRRAAEDGKERGRRRKRGKRTRGMQTDGGEGGGDGEVDWDSEDSEGYRPSSVVAHYVRLTALAESDGEDDEEEDEDGGKEGRRREGGRYAGRSGAALMRLAESLRPPRFSHTEGMDGGASEADEDDDNASTGLGTQHLDRLAEAAEEACDEDMAHWLSAVEDAAKEREALEKQLAALLAQQQEPEEDDGGAGGGGTKDEEEEGEEAGYSDSDFESARPTPRQPRDLQPKKSFVGRLRAAAESTRDEAEDDHGIASRPSKDLQRSMTPLRVLPVTSPEIEGRAIPPASGMVGGAADGILESRGLDPGDGLGGDVASYSSAVGSAASVSGWAEAGRGGGGEDGRRRRRRRVRVGSISSSGSSSSLDEFLDAAAQSAESGDERKDGGRGRSNKEQGRRRRRRREGEEDEDDDAFEDLPTPRFRFDARDVGCRVQIHVARYGTDLPGTVTAFDRHKAMHLIVYDSGDRKWHNMREKDFRVTAFCRGQSLLPSGRRPPTLPQHAYRTDHSAPKPIRAPSPPLSSVSGSQNGFGAASQSRRHRKGSPRAGRGVRERTVGTADSGAHEAIAPPRLTGLGPNAPLAARINPRPLRSRKGSRPGGRSQRQVATPESRFRTTLTGPRPAWEVSPPGHRLPAL